MKWYICLLAALLLPSAVLTQENSDLNPDDVNWLNRVLGTPPTSTTTSTSSTTAAPQNTILDPVLDQDFNESAVCTTDTGENGICVLIQQCKDGVIDNTTLIDLRIGSCPHYLQMCCLRSAATRVQPTPPPVTAGCGWSNPGAGIFRTKDADNINRKTYADYGEYPWMVAVMRAVNSEEAVEWKQSDYYGGGAIIHPSVVITIAHKVDWQTPSQIKCRAGEWDTQTTMELYPTQERLVNKKIIHEEYYRTPAVNDVALLILVSPFNLEDAPHIGVACLSPRVPAPATNCYSMGWGKDFQQKNKNAVILKKVELSYVEPGPCQAALRRTRVGPRYTLHDSHLCAGGVPGVDTCKGDGGSSLVCPIQEGADSNRYAVYGLVAFGIGCGKPIPAVYANIPKLYAWVDTKMAAEKFDTSSYKF
ncbi:phenoloxidase-activating factor 2 isoform X1 [Papilio machaon]|uniref:phenoloxidase-activating factor 2 isoform X1 n=1 Tax=Papilio machaon TaxID=76193 RepID=UPI001E662E03|nr:phenoloxidase-activating factor 2 isoform X1 [Papilio machaon]